MRESLPFRRTALCAALLSLSATAAAGDKIFVPMSWCIVEGTPAALSPPNNIGADNETDAIIWRRHERPTDTIYTPQANLSLRSAINDAWSVLDFPIIADPDPTGGLQLGDIRGEDVNVNGAEFFAIMNACDAAYTAIGRAGIGITAVNVNLFHDAADAYVGTIGWGGCTEAPAGTCVVPYNGLIGVVDNRYLHPDSPNRTRPDGGMFATADPRDVLVGHEVGHALSLDHVNDPSRMMNPFITGANFALTATEVLAVRANALNVPGVELDPPGVFNPGPWQATRIPDEIDRLGQRPDRGFLDLASANMAFHKETGEMHLEVQLRGTLPTTALPEPPCEFWFLADTDDDAGTGIPPEQLRLAGLPPDRTGFEGADLLMRATFEPGPKERLVLTHDVIALGRDGNVRNLTDAFRAEVRDLTVYRVLAGPDDKLGEDRSVIANSIAWVSNPHLPGFDVVPRPPIDPVEPKPARVPVQALISIAGDETDVLDPENRGRPLVLEDPSFPHCFPPAAALAGSVINVDAEGFPPGSELHILLGDEELTDLNRKADDRGEASFPVPIPADTSGERLLTVGVIGKALSADCTVTVRGTCDRADIDGDGVVTRRDIAVLTQDFRNAACR